MTFLPIQFWASYNKTDFEHLNSNNILDVVESYLKEKGYSYIRRTENKIVFHSIFDGLGVFDMKTRLVSGVVKIEDTGKKIKIVNGNWLALLIAIPFLIFIFLAKTEFSTLDSDDLNLIWGAFAFLFIGNLIIRIAAHLAFRGQIQELILTNFASK